MFFLARCKPQRPSTAERVGNAQKHKQTGVPPEFRKNAGVEGLFKHGNGQEYWVEGSITLVDEHASTVTVVFCDGDKQTYTFPKDRAELRLTAAQHGKQPSTLTAKYPI